MSPFVVVGVDGSECSLAAIDLAAREAALRDRPLRVVHAFIWPYLHVPLGPSPYGPPEGGLRNEAERLVSEAVERARSLEPDLSITREIVVGAPGAVLISESRSAALVVIGDRGLGGFTGLLAGSVAVQLAAHASCPVLVVRGEPRPDGEILLAVDGSAANAPAVEFAFQEAALRVAPLVAVHAWIHPVASEPGDMLPLVYDVAEVEDDEARVLAGALAGWREKYPDVTVRQRVVRGHARPVLIEASKSAQVLVVGARGRGGFTGLLLGSVSQAMLHHADCPVAVVSHTAAASR